MLVIAGSDTSGGAGLQADLRTAVQLGARALTVATALTAQSSTRVYSIAWLSCRSVQHQLDAALAEAPPDAVKIGMIASASIARAVAKYLSRLPRGTPVVYDPVFAASSDGTSLWHSRTKPTTATLRELLACVTVLTPTWHETGTLLGTDAPTTAVQAVTNAQRLLEYLGPEACVVLKGGDAETNQALLTDRIIQSGTVAEITRRRIAKSTHGTGCVFATALALELGTGRTNLQAVQSAGTLVARWITQVGPPGARTK